jgi:hypothetical protein
VVPRTAAEVQVLSGQAGCTSEQIDRGRAIEVLNRQSVVERVALIIGDDERLDVTLDRGTGCEPTTVVVAAVVMFELVRPGVIVPALLSTYEA